jgi:hypothetical protein
VSLIVGGSTSIVQRDVEMRSFPSVEEALKVFVKSLLTRGV